MDSSRPVSERVRPILDAMERSIDAARHRRLHPEGMTEPTSPPATPASPASPESTRPQSDETVPRLKARPKRPSSFSAFDGGYRSQAG